MMDVAPPYIHPIDYRIWKKRQTYNYVFWTPPPPQKIAMMWHTHSSSDFGLWYIVALLTLLIVVYNERCPPIRLIVEYRISCYDLV